MTTCRRMPSSSVPAGGILAFTSWSRSANASRLARSLCTGQVVDGNDALRSAGVVAHDEGFLGLRIVTEDERRLVPEPPRHPVVVHGHADERPHGGRASAERSAEQRGELQPLAFQLHGIRHVLRHTPAAGSEMGTDHYRIVSLRAGAISPPVRRRIQSIRLRHPSARPPPSPDMGPAIPCGARRWGPTPIRTRRHGARPRLKVMP